MMSSTLLCAGFFLACAWTFSAAQTSCRGRCGIDYYRGYICQCDYGCLLYGECCKDYESHCTTRNSCKGRCGETFKRGRRCNCDSDCMKYKQCCPDYMMHCDAADSAAAEATSSCDNVANYKPKVPTLDDVQDQPAAASEENITDLNGQNLLKDEFSSNGQEEAVPETTSGVGFTLSAEQQDEDLTEPTLQPYSPELIPESSPEPSSEPSQEPSPESSPEPSPESSPEPSPESSPETSPESVTGQSLTETTPWHHEPTQSDAESSTFYTISAELTTENTDVSGSPLTSTIPGSSPQPTTSDIDVSTRPSSTSAPQTQVSPTANSPEVETLALTSVQPEADAQETTEAYSDNLEITTLPVSVSTSAGATEVHTDLGTSEVTNLPASTTQNSTPSTDVQTTLAPEGHTTENISENITSSTMSLLSDTQRPPSTVSPVELRNVSDFDALIILTPSTSTAPEQDGTSEGTPHVTTAGPVTTAPDVTKPQTSEPTSKPTSEPQNKPSSAQPILVKPNSKLEIKPVVNTQRLTLDNTRDFLADDSSDTNLCSGRPVGAVTTLKNGTMVVFRGHYFWFLDRNRSPGPARDITQVWGVPSPIDTVFTRCNCQGKTYIFKGAKYWRFENGALDPGYPKVVETGFDGLRGQVTAALSVPQYRRRRESVYFFKRGGQVQQYSYQSGTTPTCGRKVHYPLYRIRNARQAVSLLGSVINIRTSWKSFPTTITAAVSVPSNSEPEGYKYYVFSRSKSYNVRMDGQHPVIETPKVNTTPQNDDFIKCPKK